MANQECKYNVGQVWKYRTRNGEEDSRLTVLKVDHECDEIIVHVCVNRLLFDSSDCEEKASYQTVSHAPFSLDSIDQSVTSLDRVIEEVPDFEEGYRIWKDAYDNDEAGIYSVTVAEVIDLVEQMRTNA